MRGEEWTRGEEESRRGGEEKRRDLADAEDLGLRGVVLEENGRDVAVHNVGDLLLTQLGDGGRVLLGVLGPADVGEHHLVALGHAVWEEGGGPDGAEGADVHGAGDEVAKAKETHPQPCALAPHVVLEGILRVG